ncbi:MAG: UvrD-helicase domain-containing protein [Vicinamibacterales bacterium]
MSDQRLPFDEEEGAGPADEGRGRSILTPVDQAARDHAVDPSRNVVLEASAGTGKTRVLVDRYVNLLRAGVEPAHILAITFTRKAAAEMRDRIIDRLRESSRLSSADLARWRDLKDRLGDIAISTIDAFCLSLLREFPLEADVDPAFELADDTEVPRLIGESLDRTFRICRAVAREDDDVALVFAQLGERRLRSGIAALLDRRLVAPQALHRYLARGPRDLTIEAACVRAASRLREHLRAVDGGLDAFLADGPLGHPHFAMLAGDLRGLDRDPAAFALGTRAGQAAFRVLVDRLRGYFLTGDGRPRDRVFRGTEFRAVHCASEAAWKRHRQAGSAIGGLVAETLKGFRRDLNVIQARGVWRIFAVALRQYERGLEARALLDFSGVLARAVQLLKGMDEFAQSRFRLEARFRHVLVDEFQDTSRAQWDLVAQLVRNWGEGLGASADAIPPSIFIVGDRKQSIYGFRDADVAVLDEAAAFVRSLRPEGDPRRAISVSFRSAPGLLAFVNDAFAEVAGTGLSRPDAFLFRESDRFPVGEMPPPPHGGERVLGIVAGGSVQDAAGSVADEIVRVVSGAVVRDRATGVSRPARPADVAVLLRSRDSHREYERALEARGVPTYVYKGLGFFEADEVQDVVALLRYLADPYSDLRAAALLRSRLVRLSDRGVAALAPALAESLLGPGRAAAGLDAEDAEVLARLRAAVPVWLSWVDRVPPWEAIGRILRETAYAYELRGPARAQARENLKKLGGMVRRFQNRGYATFARVADHLEQLAVGDESNATIDAQDAVSLMTVHASKGLEFPVVFIVNIGRGTGGARAPIRVTPEFGGEAAVAIADYQSEADEDAQVRDREETKRLLYVAMTRARDRLYLSGTLKDGVCRMGRGSLGEVLPASLRGLFGAAVPGEAERVLEWGGPEGRVHQVWVPAACGEPMRMRAATGEAPLVQDFAAGDFSGGDFPGGGYLGEGDSSVGSAGAGPAGRLPSDTGSSRSG